MGMRDNLRDILNVFRHDEELLRLLHYLPKSIVNGIKDPLDKSLQNVLDADEDWSIRDNVIVPKYKSSDLEGIAICRINVYAGNREPTSHNYQLADQDLIIDVFTHDSYEKDYRSLWISDRLNQLLIDTRNTGVTKIKYGAGRRIDAPSEYSAYRHFYSFESAKR